VRARLLRPPGVLTRAGRTDHLLNKLIMYSIQTGLITTIGQIISMVTFSTMGWNFTHVFLSYPLGGLYCVSFLAKCVAVPRRARPRC
jgi:hypothetical protein